MDRLRNISNFPKGQRLFGTEVKTDAVTSVDKKSSTLNKFAVITRGEAKTHDLWIDREFLSQIANAGSEKSKIGVKSRFGHPGMSTDNTGRTLGRCTNFFVDGDVVRANLRVLDSARPEFRNHVLGIADEAPEFVGTSIAFEMDRDAMQEFYEKNQVEKTEEEYHQELEVWASASVFHRGPKPEKTRFKSPDPDNTKNLMHVRLKSFFAVDFVDDPAANPAGLFSASASDEFDITEVGEVLCRFIFEVDDKELPDLNLGIHPERVRRFVKEFLNNHGLSVSSRGNPPNKETSAMPNETKMDPAVLKLLGVDENADTATILARVQNLSTSELRAKQLEADAVEAKAKARVDKLISEYKIVPAHGDVWMSQARTLSEADWEKLSATLHPIKSVSAPSSAPGNQISSGKPSMSTTENDSVYQFSDGTTEGKEEYKKRMVGLANSFSKTVGQTPGPETTLRN